MRNWTPQIKEIARYILEAPPTEEMMKYIRWWNDHWQSEDLE